MLENFNLTHAETDFLLTYPDESSFTAELESRFLGRKAESANEAELVAVFDGKIVGTAGIDAVGTKYKVAHRAEFGVSVLRERFKGLLGPFDRQSLDRSLYRMCKKRRICSAGIERCCR